MSAKQILIVMLLLVPPTVAQGVTKNWIAATGNWNVAGNWSPAGVPAASDAVNIVHTDGVQRSVTLDTNTPALGALSIDLTGAGATAGTLLLPNNNNLTAAVLDVGGYNGTTFTSGRGEVVQSAGTTTVSSGGDLILGVGSGSTGTYTLGGGALVTNQSEFIGLSGAGTFNHSAGTNTLNANAFGSFFVGYNAGSTGTYNLSGTGALVSNEAEYIGYSGTGTFNQTGGSNTIVGAGNNLYLGVNPGSTGTYTISGGTLSSEDKIISGSFGAANLTIQNTGSVYAGTALEIFSGGKLTSLNTFQVGGSTDGDMEIFNGGSVVSESAFIGANVGGLNSVVTVSGPGSSFTVNNTMLVGNPNAGTLNIENQALVYLGYQLTIDTLGVVNLNGGTLRFNVISGLDRLKYNSGTIQLAGNRTLGADSYISQLFGATPTIVAGKGLTVEGTATIQSTTVVDGGTLSAAQLTGGQLLQLRRGTLNITNQAATVGAGGTFGSSLDVAAEMTVNSTLGITNQGLVTGDGQIGGTFANAAAGELRAEPGRSLNLTGANNTNAGQISLYGGMLEFTQNLTNNAGAFISGNGTLKTTTGLTNSGTMNFSGLANVVGDVTNAAGGKIISSGGGPTTFLDDVVNSGEIRTSAGSYTVFFGSVTGAGSFTGLGTVNFEGDLKPGSSPATLSFAGDVVFGQDATLSIEIGGVNPGSQYDQLSIAGKLTLGGTLHISLINGFVPTAGQTFDILNYGTLAGAFSSVVVPALNGLTWDVSQLASGVLRVAVPGDFDSDGDVDGADFVAWQTNFPTASGATLADGDADGDSDVDGADFVIWQTNFPFTPGPAVATVPETASWLLCALALLGAAFIYRGIERRKPAFAPEE